MVYSRKIIYFTPEKKLRVSLSSDLLIFNCTVPISYPEISLFKCVLYVPIRYTLSAIS